MTKPVYFVKRGEKLVGPHNIETIKKLSESLKIKPSDLIANSKDGPWHKFGDVEEELYSGGQQEGTPAPSLQPPQIAGNPKLQPCPECNASISKNAEQCPKCGVTLTDTAVDDSGLPSFGFSNPPAFIPQPSPYHTSKTKPHVEKNRNEDENLKSGKDWLYAPWRAEDGGIRYWSLKKYLAISKFLASLTFGILAYVPLAFLIVALLVRTVAPFITGAVETGENGLVSGAGVFAFSVADSVFFWIVAIIAYSVWLFLCHLLYIVMMAGCDLLRVLIDIEKNTR